MPTFHPFSTSSITVIPWIWTKSSHGLRSIPGRPLLADRILLIPIVDSGQGTGHLKRCHRLAASIGQKASLGENFPDDLQKNTLVVLDRRKTTREDLVTLGSSCTSVLLDDDGSARGYAPYVLDAIPGPRKGRANSASPGFLQLPPKGREPDARDSILVSFGGEDPAGLTEPTLKSLLKIGIKENRMRYTSPPRLDEFALSGFSRLPETDDLASKLADFGIVITSYGLTAWEAVAAGCAVLLVNPTSYHRRLARLAGFPEAGVGSPRLGRLRSLLSSPEGLESAARRLYAALGERRDLASHLESLDTPESVCAACGKPYPPMIERFPLRSYYHCHNCGIIGLYRFRTREDEYGSAYFQQEYQDQYGRSYLEDFQAIKAMAQPRLARIRRKKASGTLLDIGCAFGPFVQAAQEAGFSAHGTDISREATDYVSQTLGIPAQAAPFPPDRDEDLFDGGCFDVVTLWYVIEHFPGLRNVLNALSIRVSDGGILAFSTPHARGISGLKNRRKFLEASPRDHYTIWSRGTARRILARHGFRVYCMRVTGHHPERIISGLKPGGILFRVIGIVSRWFRLGDTFEVYAVKVSSHD